MKKERLRLLAAGMLGLPLAGIISFGIAFAIWYPQVVLDFEYAQRQIHKNTIFYDSQGTPLRILNGSENRLMVPYQDISRYLQLSVLAAEDSRFYQHRGIDVFRLLQALWVNLSSGEYRQGASTITQQLVKITLLSPEKTLLRKFRELFIALALEIQYQKQQIFEFYLNFIYLGHGNYGVEQASLAYFRKHAAELTLAESAFLSGTIKRPEMYLKFPDALPAKYLEGQFFNAGLNRQRYVLHQLRSRSWITEQEYKDALKEKIRIYPPSHSEESGGYFVQHVFSLLKNQHQIPRVSGGGLKVYTTLDASLQKIGEAIFETTFQRAENRFDQAALVSIEPETGYVRALIGGKSILESEFNRGTQAQRQPGSAFKPFIYATAFEQGFAPNSVFSDEPISFEWDKGNGEIGVYEPRNNDRLYGAERAMMNQNNEIYYEDQMTLAKAFERSVNSIAVQLLHSIGTDAVVNKVQQMDVDIPQGVGLCLALGCVETSLLKLTSAYTPFMNQGHYAEPVFILKIVDGQGRVIYRHESVSSEAVFSEWTIHQMNQMFHDVIIKGTGTQANWRGNRKFIGGKTGTTSDNRDAWFIGFSPELVTGVWIGNDDYTPMIEENGSRSPARIWSAFMQKALAKIPEKSPWTPPSDTYAVIPTCTVSGDIATRSCPDVADYHYPAGHRPYRPCGLHPGKLLTDREQSLKQLSSYPIPQ